MVNDNQDDWDQFIDSTLFSIRVKIQMTTKFSPFYHREVKVPTQITMNELQAAQQSSSEIAFYIVMLISTKICRQLLYVSL